ncbi:hypothetical protein OPQ81_008444 [Rhizoctonia solani]|nr:hypothetical protein OPQ81_008444 [Rhizoctonia solani]
MARLDGWVETARGLGAQYEGDLEPELEAVNRFLANLERPGALDEEESRSLVRKAKGFVLVNRQLWRVRADGLHQLVVPILRRQSVLSETHDKLGHKGAWSTSRQLLLRVWWPGIERDAAEYVKTCEKLFLPTARGYVGAVLVRDDLSGYIEGRRLQKTTAKAIAAFLWKDVLTRWGAIREVVTDNGTEFRGAVDILLKRYGINQIRISAYNKQANGVVERGHRTFREALLHSSDRPTDWPDLFHAALWAKRVTVRKATRYSPFYLAHGSHPLLPFDLTETTFLFGSPEPMSTRQLVARCTRMLAKLDSAIEEAKDRLTHSRQNRWLGPYIVVRVGRNGAYRLAELNGAVLAEAIAAARVIEFYPHQKITLRIEDVLSGSDWARALEDPEEGDFDDESGVEESI